MRHAAIATLFLLAAFPVAAAGPEGAPGGAAGLAQVLGALAVVTGLIYLAAWCGRRLSGGGGCFPGRKGHIRVVETRYLAPKKSLLLVEVAGEYLLLSNGSEGVSLIKQIDMLEEIEVVEVLGPERPGRGPTLERLKGLLAMLLPPRSLQLAPRRG